MIAPTTNDHVCLEPTTDQIVGEPAAKNSSANDNAPTPATAARRLTVGQCDAPRLELRPVGDGRAFIRALARVIVRRELIFAGLIAAPDPCAAEARDRMLSPHWRR